jgi:hypothetical protein
MKISVEGRTERRVGQIEDVHGDIPGARISLVYLLIPDVLLWVGCVDFLSLQNSFFFQNSAFSPSDLIGLIPDVLNRSKMLRTKMNFDVPFCPCLVLLSFFQQAYHSVRTLEFPFASPNLSPGSRD